YGEFKTGHLRKDGEYGLTPCIKGRHERADITGILPDELNEAIIESIETWNKTIEGFADDDALLSAVETRTSSPVCILRDEEYESSIKGLYPAGEGAGYAGGIMSAAMDGIRTAEKVIKSYEK
nr:FAD-dependent oxidoreductase [Lachnospiraceae bacterium]